MRRHRPETTASRGLTALSTRWRGEAELLRVHGALEAAATKERDAAELEAAWREWQTAQLTVTEAAGESGYSADRLRELVREGRLPAERAPDGEIRLRRSDLPRRPGARAVLAPVQALATQVLAGRR